MEEDKFFIPEFEVIDNWRPEAAVFGHHAESIQKALLLCLQLEDETVEAELKSK